MAPGSTPETVLSGARRTFRNLDANGDGTLNDEDARLHEAVQAVGLRNSFAVQIMASDLDGDGAVTEAELRRKRAYDHRVHEPRDPAGYAREIAAREVQTEQEVRRFMAADADKDGRVTWQEAIAHSAKISNVGERLGQGLAKSLRDLLVFAKKEGGALTLSELDEIAAGLFRSADADGNGTVSQEEFAAVQRRVAEAQRLDAEATRRRAAAEARAGCTLPKASDRAKVVLLSAYEADGLSTTTIGSQDVGTGTGTVTVEPGDGPVYIVIAAFRPVIWRFSGAVERIERVALGAVMTGPASSAPTAKSLAGATGVPAERITFLPRTDCLGYFTETPSGKAATVAALVRRETGKEPVVAGRYGVAGFAVPSGEIRTSGRADRPMLVISKLQGMLKVEGGANVVVEAGASDLASEIARFYPGGLVEIDPAIVTASEQPARYEVLPNQAGLLQLLQRGALVRNKGGEFIIREKIRFPAELNGAHSARFLLARGVPLPDGSPGHSCVIVEETGEPLGGRAVSC